MIPFCVCVVVQNSEGQFAASARRHDSGQWGLPGGKIEAEDGTPEEVAIDLDGVLRRAAVRELREETGLVVDPVELHAIYAGICRDESGSDPETYSLTYWAPQWTGTLQPKPGEPEADWVMPETLLNGAFGDYNKQVQEHLEKARAQIDPDHARAYGRRRAQALVDAIEALICEPYPIPEIIELKGAWMHIKDPFLRAVRGQEEERFTKLEEAIVLLLEHEAGLEPWQRAQAVLQLLERV